MPCQWVSSLVHLVTQLMSTVGISWGRASSSSQVQRFGSLTLPRIEKSHLSRGVCGVGPADSTGKRRSRYCPGGIRSARSLCWRRPRKPREMNPPLMLFTSTRLYILCLSSTHSPLLYVFRALTNPIYTSFYPSLTHLPN